MQSCKFPKLILYLVCLFLLMQLVLLQFVACTRQHAQNLDVQHQRTILAQARVIERVCVDRLGPGGTGDLPRLLVVCMCCLDFEACLVLTPHAKLTLHPRLLVKYATQCPGATELWYISYCARGLP